MSAVEICCRSLFLRYVDLRPFPPLFRPLDVPIYLSSALRAAGGVGEETRPPGETLLGSMVADLDGVLMDRHPKSHRHFHAHSYPELLVYRFYKLDKSSPAGATPDNIFCGTRVRNSSPR